MNKVGCFILLFLFLSNTSYSYITQEKEKTVSMDIVVENAIKHATEQSLILAEKVSELPGKLPKSIGKNGELETSTSDWWCSGFFPGVLWYLYENSGNEAIKNYAVVLTKRIEKEQYKKDTHDLGFMLYCSFGNAYTRFHVSFLSAEWSSFSVE
ncbi:MAG: hypothetical protein LBC40_02920 [Dysgonamonadaceae bacterium]|jgi:hypothetical protein|nr:hypothetical protein [Dysgonamonadaceae bacterium]